MGKEERRKSRTRGGRKDTPPDETVREAIRNAERQLQSALQAVEITDLNPFQRKQIYRYFERGAEYKIKAFPRDDHWIMKIYPVGNLRRLAEQKAQEVLMKGEIISLPPLGSFERFVIHDYLKDRSGLRTESCGEGEERHIEIHPQFGRMPKKIKRRLT
ncbi:hypothetical protein JW906_00435 [bacterium]|nr:hypothetical protein [bacterium]